MKKILKNTLTLLNQRERRQFYSFIFLDIIISILDIASLALLLLIINFCSQPAATVRQNYFEGLLKDNHSIVPVAVFLFFFGAKNLMGYLVQKMEFRFVYHVAARLSERNFLYYLEGSYTDYASTDSSIHIRKISQQPVEFAHYVLAGIQQIITQGVLIITALSMVCWFNPRLFILLFLILMPPVLGIAFFIRKRTRAARTNIKTMGEKTLQHLKEGLSGYIESNMYGKHEFFTKRYAGWQRELNDQLSKLQSIQGLSGRLLEVFAVMGLFILILVGKWSGNENDFNVISIGAFMAAAYKTMPGVVKILNCTGQIRTYAFTVNDMPATKRCVDPMIAGTEVHNIHTVDFKNISFAYNQRSLLNNFNLSVRQGDFIGISGLSGNGKTTLLNLLLGFIQQDNGTIFINDAVADVRQRRQYRKQVAYVKQQPFVLHDSILNNIILNDKTVDEQKLEAAVAASGLDGLLNKNENGLNKLVTEDGKNISGGQRQRLVIARALYKDADLIILDEPFNELDKGAERELLKTFTALSASGKMIILISHNKESLSFCNKIISLDEK